MKPENKQRFSIRKYAIGAASVLIGFAFQAQAVAADGVVPVTTEDQPTVQTTGESAPQTSEGKLETASSTENVAPAKPVVTEEAKKIESEKEENKELLKSKHLQPKKINFLRQETKSQNG